MIDSYGTQHARSCQIAAGERPRVGSKHMATFQAVAQTQSGCLIAARERTRAGSKQMATYQAVVVAQTKSGSSSSNLCRSVATQTWSAHVASLLLHTIHYLVCSSTGRGNLILLLHTIHYLVCSSTGRGNLILSTNTSKTCVLLLFSVRTSNELMSRMNEYREQRSRILVPRSRISFSRRVIATKAC